MTILSFTAKSKLSVASPELILFPVYLCGALTQSVLYEALLKWRWLDVADLVNIGFLSGIRGPYVVWLWCLCFPLWSTWSHWIAEVSYAGPPLSSTASSSCSGWPICSASSSCNTLCLKWTAHSLRLPDERGTLCVGNGSLGATAGITKPTNQVPVDFITRNSLKRHQAS